ncbi:MAG: Hsp20/alpha crystallin family protein [Candidatus Niyogibacteria bacterium]|nr:Hsp20/alpha crystallin family protein [Candidatus Niyogibacteria bacterium]
MPKSGRSFFEILTGSASAKAEENADAKKRSSLPKETDKKDWLPESDEADLAIDVFQTPNEITIQTMVAGVKPEELDISITQDMITIKGTRRKEIKIEEKDYYFQELYWGKFSKSIMVPEEIDEEGAEATIKNGLLTIRLPRIDKERTHKLKIKSA